ncbi:MAG: ACP S-malonyltransferase [Anaerolineae bacterium]|nr:ACP S-malonyltransferase [Anaerolineae bacterium]
MPDGSTTALLFPGQGSQAAGMGCALAERYHVARQTFEEANDILGYDLARLCFDGPEEDLNETSNTQPALYVAGVAALRTLYELIGESFTPACTAGHSLGELTALTAAGALSFPDGLRLVRRRGELMRDADKASPGGMAALLGVELSQVQAMCDEAQSQVGGVLVIANDNCPGQIVIAGNDAPLTYALDHAAEMGIKRAVRLPISIASHSPLMTQAQAQFRMALDATPFSQPVLPVVANTTARPLSTVEEVRAELNAQLTSRVRWTESMQAMIADGVTTFIELGSKDVLTGLLKRIDRGVKGYVADSPAGMEALVNP